MPNKHRSCLNAGGPAACGVNDEDSQPRPRRLKRVIIREEFVALTGDYKKAVLLHQLEYRQSQAYDLDRYLEEEGGRMVGDAALNARPVLSHGWFQQSAKGLADDTFLRLSDSNVLAHLQHFVEMGWLQERANPKQKWDRRKQYRLDLAKLRVDLEAIGYHLEGWASESLKPSNSTFSVLENASSETENGVFKTEDRVSVSEDRSSKTKERYTNTPLKHTRKHDTQHKAPPPGGAGMRSKFSPDECREYAEHLRRTGQGITNPGGYATAIYRTGEADQMIERFLDSVAAGRWSTEPKAVDASRCPDCGGGGVYYPDGYDKGVAKCRHDKLIDAGAA